ncbi:S8 family serine peptidase [Flavobacterium sp.]|uniref:S8 family peptidase n=1 Tax=Flavobacterium sp. TaxID=239 RepID=UPI0024884832|nr:S8 family serine peptidase [Flavobacterium sp.]MDI1317433.1 S8 family serine peptidase [Flavobacterium sp.]
MQTNKFPFRYFLILFLMLLLAILFWVIVFGFNKNSNGNEQTNIQRIVDRVFIDRPNTEEEYWHQEYLPEQAAQINPIDTTKIINDTLNQRRIVSNLVNIAIKNTSNSIAKFANELKQKYPSDEYKIVYIDSVVNRLQVQLPDKDRVNFKTEVKAKLNQYKLLVWDETLFDYVKTFNDPKLKDNSASWYLKAININKAWDQTTGDKKIVIAVIDNGFDLNHPELVGKAVKPYNVIDKSENVSPSKENHGTHVTSTIVANGNNNQGLVGICPECSFMPIKVEDQNGMVSNTYIIDAILYAIKNKADVVNLSLGMQIPMGLNIPLERQKEYINSSAKDETEFWDDLFNYASEKKVTCVLAAGNSNILTGFDPFQRAKSTIKVGAVNQNGIKAGFSNFGNYTTIYAPGTNIYGAKPGNSYEVLQGTSMAAPIISGLIGLIKSKNKNISNQEILKILDANTITKNNIKIIDIVSSIN